MIWNRYTLLLVSLVGLSFSAAIPQPSRSSGLNWPAKTLAPSTTVSDSTSVKNLVIPTEAPHLYYEEKDLEEVLEEGSEDESHLVKREKGVIVPKKKQPKPEEIPQAWIRTIYGTKVEVVSPTVIDGITFSAEPNTDPLAPWISMNKQGRPKTIKPHIKNGQTKNASPSYSTYFKTATTIVYDQEQLKAHNMKAGDKFTKVEYLDEDDTYVQLNPLIRCTPDRYTEKGKFSKDKVKSEPFCTPSEWSNFHMGKPYFITWFTRFFENEDQVRLVLAYTKKHRSLDKRAVVDDEEDDDVSDELKEGEVEELDNSTDSDASGTKDTDSGFPNAVFWESEWLDNIQGYYPLEVQSEWLLGNFEQSVILAIQPKSQADDEVDFFGQGIQIIFKRSNVVIKNKKIDSVDVGPNDSAYIIALTLPTLVLAMIVIMYCLVHRNRRQIDIVATFKSLKNKDKNKHSKGRYARLPVHNEDIELQDYPHHD